MEEAGTVPAAEKAGSVELAAAVMEGMAADVEADEDMIEREQSDTKVVDARVLPCLGRRGEREVDEEEDGHGDETAPWWRRGGGGCKQRRGG